MKTYYLKYIVMQMNVNVTVSSLLNCLYCCEQLQLLPLSHSVKGLL